MITSIIIVILFTIIFTCLLLNFIVINIKHKKKMDSLNELTIKLSKAENIDELLKCLDEINFLKNKK